MKPSLQKTILFLTMTLAIGLLMIITWMPDLSLLLRTQIPVEIQDSLVRTFSWSPTSKSDVGEHRLTVVVADENGSVIAKDIPITVEDQNLAISDVTITPRDTGAVISWKTADMTLPVVDFDVVNEFRKQSKNTPEGQRNNHNITLEDLRPCTKYRYRISAIGVSETITDHVRSFITTGCTGNADVRGTAQADIIPSGGGFGLPNKVTVEVPDGAIEQSVHFQAHQLDRDAALAVIGSYKDLSPVTGLYQLGALSDPNTSISSFNQPLRVTVHYNASDHIDLSTLTLGRYDGSNWQDMENCEVSESDQTITCTTTEFSAVAGFAVGERSSDEEPEQSVDNDEGGDSDEGDDGGGGGGGGGDDSPVEEVETKRNYVYFVNRDHRISGSFSGVVKDGAASVVRLAHSGAVLAKNVQTPTDDYWLDVKVRHDKPGPVRMAVYINNKAWKVISLDKADNQYRVHRVGLMRGFRGGTIRFRLLNDIYDKLDPSNEDKDRNLFIEWWRLTNEDVLSETKIASRSTPSGTGGGSTAGRLSGQWLLPNLNQFMRAELGPQYVTFDVWYYYAWRLTLPASHPASIRSDAHLRTVMRYWKGVQPERPYGEILK